MAYLISHGPEEAAPVVHHALDDVALLSHGLFESAVLGLPLLVGQVQPQVGVLVLGVVPSAAAVGVFLTTAVVPGGAPLQRGRGRHRRPRG